MPNNQFVNLEELSVTTQALLSKINEQSNLKVNKHNVSAEYTEGTKIAEIEDVEIYAPIQEIDTSNLVTQSQLSNVMIKNTDYVTAGQISSSQIGYNATAEGSANNASGQYSHAEGRSTTASATGAHAEGGSTTASGIYSHAEGQSTNASATGAHAEGYYTRASQYAHAEGESTTASGEAAHAEGYLNTASGTASHAEGQGNTASGYYSHVEGQGNTASGYYSHAEGQQTVAQRRSQHVFGEYNILDTSGSTSTRGTYVEIVGKGSGADYRSNARTLDWYGNEILAGKLTVGTGPSANMDVTTKDYVDSAIITAIGNVNSFNVDIVSNNLPTTDIDAHTIYFKSNSTTGSNVYDEYMYINNNWELIGSTAIDLTPYALSANLATVATSGDYDDLLDAPTAENDEDVEDMLDSFDLDYTTTPSASINMWQGGNY